MPWHPDGRPREGGRSGFLRPRMSGSSSAMSGIRARCSGSGGWERSGNHGRSYVRSAALFCSLVRGFICGNMRITWWRGCGCFPGGQGVAGSNPAVPTGNQVFSNIVTSHKSQQRAILLCNGHSSVVRRSRAKHLGGSGLRSIHRRTGLTLTAWARAASSPLGRAGQVSQTARDWAIPRSTGRDVAD